MGQPILAFFHDEYKLSRERSAIYFGLATLFLGFICVWLYPGGAFDEFDFWTGTFALVVFALLESIVFAFVFGIDKGWEEITRGADIIVPQIFKFFIKYITPLFIAIIFIGALIKPDTDWITAFSSLFNGNGWPFAADSVIGVVFHVGTEKYVWFDNGEPTRELVKDGTRLLLLLTFITFAYLVHNVWAKKKAKNNGGVK